MKGALMRVGLLILDVEMYSSTEFKVQGTPRSLPHEMTLIDHVVAKLAHTPNRRQVTRERRENVDTESVMLIYFILQLFHLFIGTMVLDEFFI